MTAAVVIGLRASVVVIAALAATLLLRKRSASLRHWVLAAGLFAAVTVAPLSYALPSWDVPSSYVSAFDRPTPATGGVTTLVASPTFDPAPPVHQPTAPAAPVGTMVNVLWLVGFVVSLAIVIARIARIACVTRNATVVVDPRWQSNVIAFKTSVPGIVGTWGWWRPCLLLPDDCETWTDDRIRIVLRHELAHIRRGDWLVQMSSEIVRAAFWYNPLFWIACARLRRESEQASDDAVLETGVPPTEYASHLLDLARASRPVAAVVPVARPSTLEWRIVAMLNASLVRRRPTRRTIFLACAVIAGITLSASSFRAATVVQPMPLTGTVYDMTGGVLPAAALTLENENGIHLTATTDRNGHFDFGVVSPGSYRLLADVMGFMALRQDVLLDSERAFNRSITMQVGTLQETVTIKEQRKAGAAAASPGPLRIGGNLRAPMKTRDVHPIYPQAMRDAGFEGDVPLGATIGVDGHVTSVRGLSASAHPALTQAAIDAVRQWEFTPTLLNGKPVEVFMTVTVRFSLED